MLHPTRVIEERLRRLVVLAGGIATLGWIAWVTVPGSAFLERGPALSPWWPVVVVLCVLDLLLVLAGVLAAAVVLAMYSQAASPTGAVGLVLAQAQHRRARLERRSWLPLEIAMALTPLLVLVSVRLQSSVPTGHLSQLDYRLSFGSTLVLVVMALVAAARMPASWAIAYVALAHALRFALYLVIAPAVIVDAFLVVAPSAAYAGAAVLLVSYIRRAAASLDRRMTVTTSRHQAVSRSIAQEDAATAAHSIVDRMLAPALRAATAAGPEAQVDSARLSRGALDALDVAVAPAVLDPVPGPLMAAQIGQILHPWEPGCDVEARIAPGAQVPVTIGAHLRAALRVIVAGTPAPARARVVLTVEDDLVEIAVHPSGLSQSSPPDVLARATSLVRAVPGGAIRTENCSVRLSWRGADEAADLAALARDDLADDVEDELGGYFKLRHVYPHARQRRWFLALVAALLTLVAITAVLTMGHYTRPWIEWASLALTAALAGAGLRGTMRRSGEGHYGTALMIFLSAGTVALQLLGAINLRSPNDFVYEAQWWHGTAAILFILWISVMARPTLAIGTAVLNAVLVVGWALASGVSPALIVSGMPLTFSGLVLMSAMVAWTRTQMVRSALARRRQRRSTHVDGAYRRSYDSTARDVMRDVDALLRPFLSQLASGLPLTGTTRDRAAQLVARLEDERRAPCFRGTEVARAAADARARGVRVEFEEDGILPSGIYGGDDFVLARLVHLTVQAIDAAVDGSVRVSVNAPGAPRAALIVTEPDDDDPRRIEMLADASVSYDGIRVPATREDFR